MGAVIATVVAALGLLPLNTALVVRTLGVTVRQLWAKVWRPLIAAGVMYAVTVLAQPPIDAATLTAARALVLLAIFVPLGAITYVGVALATWKLCGSPPGAETVVLEQLVRRWRKLAGRTESP